MANVSTSIISVRGMLSFVARFAMQTVLATVGAIFSGSLIVILIAALIAMVTKNDSGGNFVDHLSNQKVAVLLNEPFFIVPVIVSFVFGWFEKRFFRSHLGAWVWVLPAMALAWNLFTWKNAPGRPYWTDVWNNYFGTACGSSECIYEWLVTAPFYTSLAYSLSAFICSRYSPYQNEKVMHSLL